MTKWQMAAMLGLGVGLFGISVAEQEVAAQKPRQVPGWHTNYAQARALARQTGKPMFVVFRCQP